MLKPGLNKPAYSPSPWARGLMYSLLALGALLYGHLSGERPLTPMKWAVLGAVAVGAGVALALLQAWARSASERNADRERGDDSAGN
ncbi:MAG TPA: hypothetical protein VGM51_08990 [Armatimonadota bacterium]|jgi:hypothetical protein